MDDCNIDVSSDGLAVMAAFCELAEQAGEGDAARDLSERIRHLFIDQGELYVEHLDKVLTDDLPRRHDSEVSR